MSLRIALVGYGRMGKAVEAEAVGRGHTIVAKLGLEEKDKLKALYKGSVDVVIEFTHPESALGNFQVLLETGIPLVTGTTGWTAELETVKGWVEAKGGAFLYSSNFSPGVNMLFHLNQVLARMMNQYPEFDAYIEEAHHRHKKDAPSGTAISLAEGVLGELERKQSWEYTAFEHRPPQADELSIAVTRAGEIIGKHAVVFRSEIEEIRISHEAFNRRGFALGAVLGAEWLRDKKGFYNFAEIFR